MQITDMFPACVEFFGDEDVADNLGQIDQE
jgi:hypothetical protein